MQDPSLKPFLKQLLSQVNKLHYPWVHADDMDKWPKGLFEKLLEMKVLRPSSRISTICECPACREETAEPFWMEYPDGRKVPMWYCQSDPDETDRIEIDPKWLRMWDIIAENIPQYLIDEKPKPIPAQTSEPVTAPIINEAPTDIDLPKCHEKAYQSYLYAEMKLGREISDKEAYRYLAEYGIDGYDLPDYPTWKRYVLAGRKAHGTHKNRPRGGRKGRSIVGIDQL